MQQYNFVIKHKSGTENIAADALSCVHFILTSMVVQVVVLILPSMAISIVRISRSFIRISWSNSIQISHYMMATFSRHSTLLSNTWDLVLHMAEFECKYNSSVNRTTGHSPFEIVMGL